MASQPSRYIIYRQRDSRRVLPFTVSLHRRLLSPTGRREPTFWFGSTRIKASSEGKLPIMRRLRCYRRDGPPLGQVFSMETFILPRLSRRGWDGKRSTQVQVAGEERSMPRCAGSEIHFGQGVLCSLPFCPVTPLLLTHRSALVKLIC
jgi:hypothetical protein